MPQDANDPVLDTSADAALDEDLDLRGEGVAEVEADGAKSSDAQDVTATDRSAIDVVRDVVKERDPAAAPSADATKEGEAADPKGAQKEPDEDNYSDVPFHKHPRFQQLLRQEKASREDAGRYRNVEGFLNQHGVKGEEASNVLQILALSKTDAPKAWAQLKPLVQQLLIDAGEVLPTDLRTRVESRELNVEAANEIAKERARAVSLERARETDQQRSERQRQDAHVEAIRGAANTWEADRKAKDPNFEAKKPQVMKELAWIHTTEGKADTPDKVREQLERAYKAVPAIAAPVRRKVPTAPTVGEAKRPAAPSSASQSQRPSNEPVGALKFIKRQIEARGAA